MAGEEEGDGVVGDILLLAVGGNLVLVDDGGEAGLGVLLLHVPQLLDDDLPDPPGIAGQILQVVDLVPEGLLLPDPLEDILLVDVAQLDLRHVLRLDLVDAEADHQVGHHVGLALRLPDDLDGLVDVQKDALEALEEMELVLFLVEGEIHPPPDALCAPGAPLLQQLPDPQDLGRPGDEDVEVAGDGILQRGGPVELGHELVRVHAPLEVDGQLQAVQIRLVPHVGDFLQLPGLDQLRHLVQDGLHGSGVGNLVDFHHVLALHVPVLAPDADGALAGAVDLLHSSLVVDHLPSGGKVGAQEDGGQVAVRIFQIGDGGVADLAQVKPAQLGGHAHGDALVGGY